MNSLIICHLEGSDPPQFQVRRLSDGKDAEKCTVRPPLSYPVEGRPDSDLMTELRWYLESFLDYPFSPETEHAERVWQALQKWGEEGFESLFGGGQPRGSAVVGVVVSHIGNAGGNADGRGEDCRDGALMA